MSTAPNANYVPEVCAWCAGSGMDRTLTDKTCFACHGQGRVQVAEPPMQCVHCGGDGSNQNPNLSIDRCHPCGGTGWSLRWISPSKS